MMNPDDMSEDEARKATVYMTLGICEQISNDLPERGKEGLGVVVGTILLLAQDAGVQLPKDSSEFLAEMRKTVISS